MKLPAPEAILALGAMSGRMGGPVVAALDDAMRALRPAEAEPVLGAPET